MTPGEFAKPDKLAMLTYLSLYYEFFSTKELKKDKDVPIKKEERSGSFGGRLLSRRKKKGVAEESNPAVKREGRWRMEMGGAYHTKSGVKREGGDER